MLPFSVNSAPLLIQDTGHCGGRPPDYDVLSARCSLRGILLSARWPTQKTVFLCSLSLQQALASKPPGGSL